MSMETLRIDLKSITEAAPKFSPVESDYVERLDGFIHNQLLPWMDNQVTEMEAQDDAVYALVHQTEDILHSENAALFMSIIETAEQLIGAELRTRVGNDQRILNLIGAWKKLAAQGREVLEDIVIPDEEYEEEDEEEDDDDTEESPEAGK